MTHDTNAASRADDALRVASSLGLPLNEQLRHAMSSHRQLRQLIQSGALATPVRQTPDVEALAKLSPDALAKAVREAALDRVAAKEAADLAAEWADQARDGLSGAVQRSIGEWIPLLAAQFTAALDALRADPPHLPDEITTVRPDQLSRDSLIVWRDAEIRIVEVENLLQSRAAFARIAGEDPAVGDYGRTAAYCIVPAPLPTDDTDPLRYWQPRHALLVETAAADMAIRWVRWLQAEREGWLRIDMATNDLVDRVDALTVYGNLGWSIQSSSGGRDLAAAQGQLAGWYDRYGRVSASA
jgi:hypothetical protein